MSKLRTIPFSSLKESTRAATYILFGIILLTSVINIYGVLNSNSRIDVKFAEIVFQTIIYPSLCYFIRTALLIGNKLKEPAAGRIAGTMLPLMVFAAGFMICFNTGLAVFTIYPGYGYPEGINSILLTLFIPFLILFTERFVYADHENIYAGIRSMRFKEIANAEISSGNNSNIYRVRIKSNDGNILTFGIYGKSEKDRLLKCLEVHGAAMPQCFNAAKES